MDQELQISHINLEDITVSGNNYIGGLIGFSDYFRLSDVNIQGFVSGNNYIGGLVGLSRNSVYDTVLNMTVIGKEKVGGVAGVLSPAHFPARSIG